MCSLEAQGFRSFKPYPDVQPSDVQEEAAEEEAGRPAVESAAVRTRGGAGGQRPEGSRRRSKRADQRGAAEPLIRGGPTDLWDLGLGAVPDANHKVPAAGNEF